MINKIQPWLVHLFTALGAFAGFLSLEAIVSNELMMAFVWLAVAFFIDGIDGTLARRYAVKENIPLIDGNILDNIVDYLNYVFIPAFMIYWFDLVPVQFKLLVIALVLIVSCYTFTNIKLKTKDNYFRGFPALWNIVVFYLFILETSSLVNLVIIIFFLVMTFVPIKYIHPLRVQKGKKITLGVMFLWSLFTICLLMDLGGITTKISDYNFIYFWGWVITNIYFVNISIIRSLPLKQ